MEPSAGNTKPNTMFRKLTFRKLEKFILADLICAIFPKINNGQKKEKKKRTHSQKAVILLQEKKCRRLSNVKLKMSLSDIHFDPWPSYAHRLLFVRFKCCCYFVGIVGIKKNVSPKFPSAHVQEFIN